MTEQKQEIVDIIEEKFEVGRVYRIVRISDDTKPNAEQNREMYIGATMTDLDTRMAKHKSVSGKDKEYPLHVVMQREGVDNFRIEQISEFKNVSRSELYHEEAKLIESFDTVKKGWNGKYGSPFCIHGSVRKVCVPCEGSAICIHKKRREYCKLCGGSAICEHGRFRSNCVPCGGVGICEHYRRTKYCSECRPCQCCPQTDEVGSAENPKHLRTPKHHYNWRIYQILWTSGAGQLIPVDERHDYVLSMMMNEDESKGKLMRVIDHRLSTVRKLTYAELDAMIVQGVDQANIPIINLEAEPETKKVGRKTTVEFGKPDKHRADCLLPENDVLNCGFCNPCVACDGTAANWGPHRKTQKHKDNEKALEERIALENTPGAVIPEVRCHAGHWKKCYKCNRCQVCQVPRANYSGHEDTEIHKAYLRARGQ